mgnify:CR=1 FL=1
MDTPISMDMEWYPWIQLVASQPFHIITYNQYYIYYLVNYMFLLLKYKLLTTIVINYLIVSITIINYS